MALRCRILLRDWKGTRHATGAEFVTRGAEAVLLGGTDLSLAFDGTGLDCPLIDSAKVHAAAIARAAMLG